MKSQRRIVIMIIIAALVISLAVTALCELAVWDCPECGKKENTGKFCGECGHPASTNDEEVSGKTSIGIPAAGDIIPFGTYPQTSDGTDQTPIEWIVLDVQGGKSLLLSRHGLDAKPYSTKKAENTWEKCSLRAWLNDEFLNSAFTPKERSAILLTSVDNNASQGYKDWNSNGGSDTQDCIFLLSYTEANRYLDVIDGSINNTKSRVAPTSYAKSHGAVAYSNSKKTTDGDAAGWWWLRSPGSYQDNAAYVRYDGSLSCSYVSNGTVAVRPAFWMNLESDIF